MRPGTRCRRLLGRHRRRAKAFGLPEAEAAAGARYCSAAAASGAHRARFVEAPAAGSTDGVALIPGGPPMKPDERISEPQAVKDLLVEVLKVWVTRDNIKLTDAQISERAANGALALTTAFDVRRRDARPRWVAIAASRAPDPRVSHHSSEYGKRQVSLTLLIDSDGQLWEMLGRDNPTPVGGPPLVDAMAPAAGDES